MAHDLLFISSRGTDAPILAVRGYHVTEGYSVYFGVIEKVIGIKAARIATDPVSMSPGENTRISTSPEGISLRPS